MTVENKNKNCNKNCGCGNENAEFDNFINSIEEEIKSENWQALWNKYGKLITYAASTILIGVAVYGMWQKQDLQEREAISSKFSLSQNMIVSGDPKSAMSILNEIANSSKKNYATLAKFEKAAIMKNSGDKSALDIYKSIFEDKKVDKNLKSLAYIFYVNSALDLMPQSELNSKLDEFIKNLNENYIGKNWDLLAKETLAFCYIKYGKNEEAKKILETLAKTENIPQAMLERTKILLHSIS